MDLDKFWALPSPPPSRSLREGVDTKLFRGWFAGPGPYVSREGPGWTSKGSYVGFLFQGWAFWSFGLAVVWSGVLSLKRSVFIWKQFIWCPQSENWSTFGLTKFTFLFIPIIEPKKFELKKNNFAITLIDLIEVARSSAYSPSDGFRTFLK